MSAGRRLKQRFPQATLAIGEGIRAVQATFAPRYGLQLPGADEIFDHLFSDGETFTLGELRCQVIAVPGHTSDSIAYLIDDALFTGDSLFMPDGGTARCDFPGGDAAQLYRSIQRLLALPDATRVFVCHDYGPGGRDFANETTIGEQRAHNIHVHDGVAEAEFVSVRQARDATLEEPKLMQPAVKANIQGGLTYAGQSPAPSVSITDRERSFSLHPHHVLALHDLEREGVLQGDRYRLDALGAPAVTAVGRHLARREVADRCGRVLPHRHGFLGSLQQGAFSPAAPAAHSGRSVNGRLRSTAPLASTTTCRQIVVGASSARGSRSPTSGLVPRTAGASGSLRSHPANTPAAVHRRCLRLQALVADIFAAGIHRGQAVLARTPDQQRCRHDQRSGLHWVSSVLSMANVIGIFTAAATGLPFFIAGR